MNQNTQYEQFAQMIYQELVNSQGIHTIDVQHNIHLTGKSGQSHQIDVYWEYEIAGIAHKVAIECKNYQREVPVGVVRDFMGVLQDLNNVNGIIVTKVGFQKGAKKFAAHYGIHLKELRVPEEKDWEGRLRKLILHVTAIVPQIHERTPLIDVDWFKANIEFPPDGKIAYQFQGMANELKVFRQNGEVMTDFQQLDNSLPTTSVASTGLEHIFPFNDGYMQLDPIGMIKIKGVKYVYDVATYSEETLFDAKETTKAILKDALTGDIRFFRTDLTH